MKLSKSKIKIIIDYVKDKPIDKIWLFGSYARGEAHRGSDIDLVIRTEPNAFKTGLEYFKWWNDLEKLTKKKIDLVSEGYLSKYIVESVEKEKLLIYEKT
jgi:uncharacterized protein